MNEKQAFPSSITGNGSEATASVLDHRFGSGDPYTLGVEEEYQLLDPQTFDLVQHIETMLDAVTGHDLEARPGLYFCGFRPAPTGGLREMGREAKRIARSIARARARAVSPRRLETASRSPAPLPAAARPEAASSRTDR